MRLVPRDIRPAVARYRPNLARLFIGVGSVNAFLGLTFLLANQQRFNYPAFQPALGLLPLRQWAIVFLATTVFLVAGVHVNERLAKIASFVGIVVHATWGAAFLVAFIKYSTPVPGGKAAAPTGSGLFFYVAWTHYVTYMAVGPNIRPKNRGK